MAESLWSSLTTLLVGVVTVIGVTYSSPPLQLDLSSTFEELGSGPSPTLFAGVRLSEDIQPIHYDLNIIPIISLPLDDPRQFTAPGNVSILISVVNPTNNITLHANDLDIDYDNVQVRIAQTGISIRILSRSNNSAMSTYTMLLEEVLTTNFVYSVTIPFIAKVGNRLSGLYRSSYKDEAGVDKWIATTQFQKLGARMCFPSFDEPNFKATFDITVNRPEGYHSLANAQLLESVPIEGMTGWFWDVHATTVKMSTYLLAIIVSDFVSVSAPPELSNYDVKTWGPPTMTNPETAGFAATSGAQILTFFENYLQSQYQFSKLDSAAIPDFSAGAMENWALNTYRLNYLLFIDGESTQAEKWGIARVFAHEISHHWFGDLVTCGW